MAVLVKTVKLLLVLLLAAQAMSQELNSTLHSTLYGVDIAYVDEMVIFTCVVRESNSMAWTSEEYIGTGGQRLELSTGDPVGRNYSAVGKDQTVATLVSATTDEIIVSQLRIGIKSNYPTASVWCHNINAGTATSIEFLLADSTSINCDKQSVCPDETVTCICTTGNSNALAWMNNESRLEFVADDPLETRRDVSGSSTFAVLTNSSVRNGIRVMTSNLTFIASSSMNDLLTCVNVDRSTSKSVIIPVSEKNSIVTSVESCTDPTAQVTTPSGNGDASSNSNCAGPIAAAVLVPTTIVIIIALLILIIFLVAYCKQYKIQLNYKKEIKKLDKDLINEQEKTTRLKKQTEELEGEIETKESELEEKNQHIQILDERNEMQKSYLQTKQMELEQSKRKITSLEKDIERLNHQLKSDKYKVKT